MNKINYGLECDKILDGIKKTDKRPTLLLHACCAPCSSYVIEYLEKHFDLTLYFYNPNITDTVEFAYRLNELERFVCERPGEDIKIIAPEASSREFYDAVRGFEDIPEGGERCFRCYRLRLEKTAEAAARGGYDFFCTTLSISPYKNSDMLCRIGLELEQRYGVRYLPSDFKKHGGYLRSIELSSIYSLYRQNYCGCGFSKNEAEKRRG